MKLQCFREQHVLDGVSVLTLSTAEVPVADVLDRRLTDVTYKPDADALGGDDIQESTIAPQRFRYRIGESADGEVVEAEGMLVGSGGASLISFLERRYVPDGSSERTLDRLMLQLASGDIARADWLRVMEEEVFLDPNDNSYRRIRYEYDRPPCPPFVVYKQVLRGSYEKRQDALGVYRVRSLDSSAPLAVVSSFVDRVGGFAIPRWRFAIIGEFDEGFAGWDGRRYHVADRYSQLPETLRRALDRDGSAVNQPADWFVPMSDLRPEVLIRVPYAGEVSDLIDAGPPPSDAFGRRPCFLIDSRRPVQIRERPDLELLDEPELAITMLTRQTTRGCYIPQMPAAPVADLALSPDGEPARYVVGCWPR